MKDGEIDKLLKQHLSGDQPSEALRQEALRDSMARFVRIQRRRSARRRAELAAAAVLIAGIAFLGGRLSAPSHMPGSVDIAPQAAAESDAVTVPSDLVAWLDTARLFGRLGMQDRMARAVERASKLLPVDAVNMNSRAGQGVAASESIENHNKHAEPMALPDPQPSDKNISQIIAQSFGD